MPPIHQVSYYSEALMNDTVSMTAVSRVPADLELLIREERTKSTLLGINLNIPLSVLHQDLDKKSKVRKSTRRCFQEMWQQWFNDKGDRKWIEIFEALKQQRYNRLKNNLEKKYKPETPGMCSQNLGHFRMQFRETSISKES